FWILVSAPLLGQGEGRIGIYAPCAATPATVAVTEITVGQATNADGTNPSVPAPISGGDKLVAMVLAPLVTTSPSKVMGTAVATCSKDTSPLSVALCEVTRPLTVRRPPVTVKVPLPPPVRLGATPTGGVQSAPYPKAADMLIGTVPTGVVEGSGHSATKTAPVVVVPVTVATRDPENDPPQAPDGQG